MKLFTIYKSTPTTAGLRLQPVRPPGWHCDSFSLHAPSAAEAVERARRLGATGNLIAVPEGEMAVARGVA